MEWSEVLTESSEGKYDCQVFRAVAEEEEKDVVSDPRATHYLECIKDNERRRSIYAECPTVGVVFRFEGALGGAISAKIGEANKRDHL
jgi:hypothetical protein